MTKLNEILLVGFVIVLSFSFNALGATNKEIVSSYYKTAYIEHDPQKAVDLYVGDQFIQHNPKIADGKKAFVDFIVPFFKSHPDHKIEIKRVLADGDLVSLHVHAQSDKVERGRAIVAIFRLKDGKIVEHWDVIQDIPEKSINSNTMF